MPYIPKAYRERFDPILSSLAGMLKQHILKEPLEKRKVIGMLNYCVTRIVYGYVDLVGESYAAYNDALGVLESAKMELYRRRVSPYEDNKKETQGDVYFPLPGQVALSRDVARKEIVEIIRSVGRPYIADQIQENKYTAHVCLEFLLLEPGFTEEERQKLIEAKEISYRNGV